MNKEARDHGDEIAFTCIDPHDDQRDGRQPKAQPQHISRSHHTQQPWCQQRADHEAQSRRQTPQPSLERAEPEHQLQVLRDDEEDAEDRKEPEHIDRQCSRKRRSCKQAEIEERVAKSQLSAHEQSADQHTRGDWPCPVHDVPALSQALDAIDDCQHGDDRHPGADEVQTACPGILVLR